MNCDAHSSTGKTQAHTITEFRNQSFASMPWYRKSFIVLMSPFALVVSAIFLPVLAVFCAWAVAYNVAVQFFNLKLVQTQRREFDISRGWAQKLRQARVTATR
jgi:hypothetical protein